MRSNKYRSVVLSALMAAPIFFGMAHAQTSAQTVEELITKENQKVLSQARKEAGIAEPSIKVATGPVIPNISVTSIAGVHDELRANLMVDGVDKQDVGVGDKVARCKVQAIADQCVALAPINSKKTKAAQCPKACWTGVPPIITEAPDGAANKSPLPAGFAGMSAPAPMPR